jgi:glycosyltransferase involved in cell wall biosynthesis
VIEFVYISLYFSLGLVVLFGLKKQLAKKLNNTASSINLKEITVIIPFRNEYKNLKNIIESINCQSRFPAQILFVNDHSTDGGEKQILGVKCDFSVLNLPENQKGKKQAIRYAISFVKTNYVLTLDADVELIVGYFSSLEKLSINDLFILPVVMKGDGLKRKFFELDYALSNAMNVSISGLKRPFLASGANLLFDRNQFLKYDSYDQHKMIASGDDIFLLNDFIRNKCSIQAVTDVECSVSTDAPFTLRDFIFQRLRWIGKGSKVGDQLSNSLAMIAAIVHVGFLIILIKQIALQEWDELLLLVILKILLEMVVYYPYFKNIERLKTWFILPFTTFIYPIYIVGLMVMIPFVNPKWKGRKLNSLSSQ